MPRVKVNGWKFLYRQAGTGPDAVMLPGAAAKPFGRLLFDALAADFRVTVYEAREDQPNLLRSAELADDLHGLHKALELRPGYLIAHEDAALIALHTAVLYPDLVAGIVMTEPSLPDVPSESSRSARSGLTTRRILLIERPVLVLCGPQTSSLALCRFLQDHLPRCEAVRRADTASSLRTAFSACSMISLRDHAVIQAAKNERASSVNASACRVTSSAISRQPVSSMVSRWRFIAPPPLSAAMTLRARAAISAAWNALPDGARRRSSRAGALSPRAW